MLARWRDELAAGRDGAHWLARREVSSESDNGARPLARQRVVGGAVIVLTGWHDEKSAASRTMVLALWRDNELSAGRMAVLASWRNGKLAAGPLMVLARWRND